MSGGVDAAVEPHISFKDISPLQKQNLFISKLNFCCEISDFSDAHLDLKREALVELLDFVSSGSAKFTEPAISAICKMCAANLFRVFPPKYRNSSNATETDDEEPMFDPAWSHLQLVYELLLRFTSLVDAKAAKKKAVSNIIYRFVYETERHNGIAELLEIFGSIISGFALPLKEEHKLFLWRALMPLHKPKSVGIYHQQLAYCIVQFVDKDPKLTGEVIKGLLKYWPVTNSQKELMFISEVEEMLEMTSMDEFQKVMVPLFRRIGGCLNSSHYQVAERAHLLWNNERIVNLVIHNRQVIVPIVFSALERNSQNHWNQAVLNLTQNIRKMFLEMDEELMLACQCKLEEEQSKSNVVAEKRRLTWENLESAAGGAASFNNPISNTINLAHVESASCSVAC
ncbi:unnamed protein product [Linum tenue]|uniref:Serine/threonine protein phosphatase 2A regulatory subunit n=1 Tax=Linum tenue TaxID=586396 RepID=A0AAV0S757_9ROSI|nr:unnamed protein product [Linum tenue]CAI0629043.1 unnamed protein product [Linum tenue]